MEKNIKKTECQQEKDAREFIEQLKRMSEVDKARVEGYMQGLQAKIQLVAQSA